MSHAHSQIFYHIVWATKKRRPYFSDASKKRLYGFLKKLMLEKDVKLLAIGGVHDHVHVCFKAKTTTVIANLVRDMKCESSKFINKLEQDNFCWQRGGGVFTVSPSMVRRTIKYILRQEEHHKDMLLAEELTFLSKL